MKYYKTQTNEVHCFKEDGSQDSLIREGMVEITIEEVKELTAPKPTTEQVQKAAENKRASLLASTDWTQLPDVPAATQQKYVAYRQALRDITTQAGYPTTITWPELPA
jgi:hypothetical protein